MSVLDTAAALAAKAASATLAALGGSRLSILIFHRVLPAPDALFPGEVDVGRFDRLMSGVARAFNILALPEAAALLKSGKLPARALVITFDDGYADNHELALPVLQRHGLTATFFVSTGFLDGGIMWNDQIIECVRLASTSSLDASHLGLGSLPLQSLDDRRAAIAQILPQVKYMSLAGRHDAIARLLASAGNPELPRTLMMRRAQVRALHEAGMDLGAHTVNHPILASLSDDEARAEIVNGRNEIEAIAGASVQTLAYPNGRPGKDYDQRHSTMAQQLGFQAAVSTSVGVARCGDDVFQLPRFTPWHRAVPRWMFSLAASQRRTRFDVAPAASPRA